jgi:hypothetical protein
MRVAKKKKPAEKPTKKAKRSKSVESMFAVGFRQDAIILTEIERAAMEVISHHYRLGRNADALRISIMHEAELCRSGKSGGLERAPTRSNAKGRLMEGDGVDLRMFSFLAGDDDRANIATIRETHDVNKSAAIRHAIRQEAKRCEAEARKK